MCIHINIYHALSQKNKTLMRETDHRTCPTNARYDPPFHFIRCYANKILETNMPQIYTLAGDSSGIAPHIGDDHGCLQSFGLYSTYVHIPTYAENYHSRITTWSTDASFSPHLIYSFFLSSYLHGLILHIEQELE